MNEQERIINYRRSEMQVGTGGREKEVFTLQLRVEMSFERLKMGKVRRGPQHHFRQRREHAKAWRRE